MRCVLLVVAVALTGCAQSPGQRIASECMKANPPSAGSSALVFFGAIGGLASAATDGDRYGRIDQCIADKKSALSN